MPADIKTKILDAAQECIQLRGYQGFSFKDLKASVGIATASMHYHYPTKGDLGVGILRRYRDRLRGDLNVIAQSQRSFALQVGDVIGVFEVLRENNLICLGTAFAGEYYGLPSEVKTELRALIEDVVNGFERILQTAQKNGEVRGDLPSRELAETLYSTLQGALTASRAADNGFLKHSTQTFLKLCQTD